MLKVTTNLPEVCEQEPKLPSLAVTVCGVPEVSAKSHSTVWPAVTVTVAGSNFPTVFGSETIFTVAVPEPLLLPPVGRQLPPPPPAVLPPPQAANASALPAATIALFQTFTLASLKNELPRPEGNGGGSAR